MEAGNPGIILTLVAFIGGFSILVFIHEWGHYIVGRMFKVRVEVFSIGFGKEIWGYTAKSGTRWRLSLIPLGGYVKFFGDASAASNPGEHVSDLTEEEKQDCLHYKPLWQRALVVLAGPMINLIVPVFVFAGFALTYGTAVFEPNIALVQKESAAEKAGLLAGDRILEIDGQKIDRFNDMVRIVQMNPHVKLSFVVERQSQGTLNLDVVPGAKYMVDRFDRKHAIGLLGVQAEQGKRIDHGILSAMSEGFYKTGDAIRRMLTGMQQLVLGMRSIKEMSGPVGIAAMAGEAASYGIENFILFMSMISLSLGIMNLMPIPVLDGGHLMFYALEAIKGKPLSKFAQEASFIAGLALVLFLMVIVTFNDLHLLVS